VPESWSDHLGKFLSEKIPGVAGIKEGIAGHQADQQVLERALTYIEQQGWLTDEAMQDLRDHTRFAMGPVQDAYMKRADVARGSGSAGIYSPRFDHVFFKAGAYGDDYKRLANSLLHEFGHVIDFRYGQEPRERQYRELPIRYPGYRELLPVAKWLDQKLAPREYYPVSHDKPGGNITPYAETDSGENLAEVFHIAAKFGSPWGNTQPVRDDRDSVQKHIQPWMTQLFEKVIQGYNQPVASWWRDGSPYASDPAAGSREENAQYMRPESPPPQAWTPPLNRAWTGGFSRDAPSYETRAIFTDPAAGALAAYPQELYPEKAQLQDEARRDLFGF
jgi:hypothetical protein